MLKIYTTESVTAAMTKNYEKAEKHHNSKASTLSKEMLNLLDEQQRLSKRIDDLGALSMVQINQAKEARYAIEAIEGWTTQPTT